MPGPKKDEDQILKEVRSLKSGNAKLLKNHEKRIKGLEDYRDKQEFGKVVAAEAVKKYKQEEAERAAKLPPPVDNTWLTKELVRAILMLTGAIVVLVGLYKLQGSIGK